MAVPSAESTSNSPASTAPPGVAEAPPPATISGETGAAQDPDETPAPPLVDGTSTQNSDAGVALPEPAPEVQLGCEPPSAGRVVAHFEVPGAQGSTQLDYFRLPFPNDVYLEQQQLQLGDFPAATAIARNFVTSVEHTADGFSASPTIIFRFSGKLDFDSLLDRFHLLDVTEPTGGSSPPLKLLYSPSGGKYVCHNALYVRPAPGHALLPGRTYAAWIDTGVTSAEALRVEASEQLTQLLVPDVPGDPVLAAAHTKFAPFRAHLEHQAILPSSILNATVFSVGQVREPIRRLVQSAAELPTPQASDWVLCDGQAKSPCPDATGERACGEPQADYAEYHALVELPIFQQGTPPYLDSGGEISWSGPVRSEPVCVALSVPAGAPPDTGFPLVLAAHGAGGSFRTHLSPAMSGLLAQGVEIDGELVRFAVLGYDAVQHGPRRGSDLEDSAIEPDILLFNLLNPKGTLGTSLQGGVDIASMSRFAKALPDTLPGALGIQLDSTRLLFWGHSQGAMQAAIALPYVDDVHAAVFSGLGAGFLQTLLLRKDPELIPTAVQQAVFDPGRDGELVFAGEYHPALALVQQLVDPVDPLHHAKLLVADPETRPLHVFHVYGANDAFSPGIAQVSFAINAELAVVQTDPSASAGDDIGMPNPLFPLSENVAAQGELWTAGVRQYAPALGDNGHFVAFSVPSASQDIIRFLSTAIAHDAPAIGQ